jgi:hypothetical protein
MNNNSLVTPNPIRSLPRVCPISWSSSSLESEGEKLRVIRLNSSLSRTSGRETIVEAETGVPGTSFEQIEETDLASETVGLLNRPTKRAILGIE